MENNQIEILKEEPSRYALTPKLLNSILYDLKKALVEKNNLIMGANKEDVKINKKQVKIKEFLKIIDLYQNSECVLSLDERKIIVYKGDPYLTLHICMQALTQRNKVLLLHDNFMVGVNEVLVNIINNVLKEYNITNLISNSNDYSIKEIEQLSELFDNMVVIGDSTTYQALNVKINKKFYPYNNLAIYCDEKEYEKLQEAIFIYSNENQYEIEVLYEDNIDDVIESINSDQFINVAILLTQNNEIENEFKNRIKGKEIFINENPFKQEVGKIYNYLE